jgi:hypothetical protein
MQTTIILDLLRSSGEEIKPEGPGIQHALMCSGMHLVPGFIFSLVFRIQLHVDPDQRAVTTMGPRKGSLQRGACRVAACQEKNEASLRDKYRIFSTQNGV